MVYGMYVGCALDFVYVSVGEAEAALESHNDRVPEYMARLVYADLCWDGTKCTQCSGACSAMAETADRTEAATQRERREMSAWLNIRPSELENVRDFDPRETFEKFRKRGAQ